jgi:glutamate synthase (ferredoxin)
MERKGLPVKQGLYDPQYEHDACGMGFVANIKGRRSHEIVRQALTVLGNLDHRGGQGCEANTGDGAGILLQIPHAFFRRELGKEGIALPSDEEYGVGMLFLPQDAELRASFEKKLENIVREEGQT